MSLTVTLANGDENTYSDTGINYAFVQLEDPAVVAGARNRSYGTGKQSLTLVLNNQAVVRLVENNPAYRPSGYLEISDAKTPKELYDELVAETDFDELAPQASTGFDSAFPYRVVVNKPNVTGIATDVVPSNETVSGPKIESLVSFKNSALVRFLDNGTAGYEYTRNGSEVGKTDIFYLAPAEYAVTTVAIGDLC